MPPFVMHFGASKKYFLPEQTFIGICEFLMFYFYGMYTYMYVYDISWSTFQILKSHVLTDVLSPMYYDVVFC